MTLKARLGKLEQPATERWRRAWEDYFRCVSEHVYGVRDHVELLKAVCEEGVELGILETVPECRAAFDTFCKRLDLPLWTTTWGWDDGLDIDPTTDKPDLNVWPERVLTTPPPEPAGAYERVEPFLESTDIVERFCAVSVLFTLTHARGYRDYLGTLDRA